MKKFVLFFVLPILLIGCATTSTEQIGQSQQTSEAPTPSQQSSIQSEPEVVTTLPKIEIQRSRPTGKEGPGLAEPAPVTSRRTWGGMFNVPAGLKPPSADTRTERSTTTQTPPSSTSSKPFPSYDREKKKDAEGTQSQKESLPSPEIADKTTTKSKPTRKPWGGMWGSYITSPSQTDSEATSTKNIEPPPASWDDYKEVDFGKFASGSYVSDYANKYVKLKCRFSSIGSEFVEFTTYPRTGYVTFIVTGVDSQLHSLRVVMRRLQAGEVFKLKPEKEITLYGKAVQVDLHTLTMEVLNIER